jgi:hypothetical protein
MVFRRYTQSQMWETKDGTNVEINAAQRPKRDLLYVCSYLQQNAGICSNSIL